MAVGHLNSVSLFDWQQVWNEVVYLEHLYEEKKNGGLGDGYKGCEEAIRALSQQKDCLSQVWGFPC